MTDERFGYRRELIGQRETSESDDAPLFPAKLTWDLRMGRQGRTGKEILTSTYRLVSS